MRYVVCLVLAMTGSTIFAQDYYSFSNNFYGQRASTRMEFAPTPERLEREMKSLEMRMMFPPFTLWSQKRWEEYKYKQDTEYYRKLYYRLKDYTLPPEEYRKKYPRYEQ